jgi:hypothetical protein
MSCRHLWDGQSRLEATSGSHDDSVMALGLAARYAAWSITMQQAKYYGAPVSRCRCLRRCSGSGSSIKGKECTNFLISFSKDIKWPDGLYNKNGVMFYLFLLK